MLNTRKKIHEKNNIEKCHQTNKNFHEFSFIWLHDPTKDQPKTNQKKLFFFMIHINIKIIKIKLVLCIAFNFRNIQFIKIRFVNYIINGIINI